jgi:zinc transport system substrate-binding protein
MKRFIPLTVAGALVFLGLAGPAPAQQKQMRVVATTSWTAAFAAAAGVNDVVTLAPADLRHPAEYELKASDVAALKGAGLIISTGFEVMAKRLAEAAGSQSIRILQIGADYSLATMRTSLLAIAEVAGSMPQARASIAALEGFMESWKAEIREAGLQGAPILVHLFQKPLMEELGFAVKGVFGPAPLEAAQIARLSREKALFIVDNWHNDVAAPLRETLPSARYASLINFPGPDGTVTLLDVLSDNRKRLAAAAP